MDNGMMPLPGKALAKAEHCMRALRRAVISYWYATIEDMHAAAIEAATATFYINILDEAVFEISHGEMYREAREKSALGRVVAGLELIRNCETHSPIIADNLLFVGQVLSVPFQNGGTIMRQVYKWADDSLLPDAYIGIPDDARPKQKRARKAALHAYRQDVKGRSVIETFFDAMSFFQKLDSRLIGPQGDSLQYAYAIVPDDGVNPLVGWKLFRPMLLDLSEPFLPDIVCRNTERRSALWPAADKYFTERKKRVRREVPAAAFREVKHVVFEDGEIVGYSGYGPPLGRSRNAWVERKLQVWRDVCKGYRYYVKQGGVEVALISAGHERLCAPDPDMASDLLKRIPPPSSPGLGLDHLRLTETFDDIYIEMRIQK